MAIRDSKIVVEIGGKVHENWQSYEIDSDFLTPADAFSMSIGLPNGVKPPDIAEGMECTIKVDGELVLTGIIDTINHKIDKQNHQYSINGRDKCALLVDCSAPIVNFKGLSLLEAVKKIVNPLGINKVELRAKADISYDKTDLEVGMSAWDAVAQLANSAGLHPWFDPDGTLIIGEADYITPPVAMLICNYFNDNNNNVKSVEHELSSANRYSEVTFLGQSHGKKSDRSKHDLKHVVKDETAKFHKPKTVVCGDAENLDALKKMAKKALSDMQLEGLSITVDLQGHYTDDNVLFKNGQRVHLRSDVFEIDDIFFVMGRRFSLSRNSGMTTTLTLKEDGVWLPDSPKRKKGKKGKKKGGPLAVLIVNPDGSVVEAKK